MADSHEPVRMNLPPISGGSLTEADLPTPAELPAVHRGAWPASVPRAESPFAQAVRRLRRSTTALIGAAIVAMLLVIAIFADVLAPQSPITSDQTQTFASPSWAHPLGTDQLGRDMLSRVIHGSRLSLVVGVSSVLLALFIGVPLGMIAGFYGGRLDSAIMRAMDLVLAFPIYLLAISLSIVLITQGFKVGPISITAGSLWLPIWIIGIVYVPYIARPVRGQVLALKETEFVLAAVGLGVPSGRILLRDILPNVTTTLIVFIPLMMALNILTESALSFLSIGMQPPDASWGTIIQDGQTLLYTRPMVALAPGVAIVLTVLALNVFGDGLRDALDPRSKLRIRQG